MTVAEAGGPAIATMPRKLSFGKDPTVYQFDDDFRLLTAQRQP